MPKARVKRTPLHQKSFFSGGTIIKQLTASFSYQLSAEVMMHTGSSIEDTNKDKVALDCASFTEASLLHLSSTSKLHNCMMHVKVGRNQLDELEPCV